MNTTLKRVFLYISCVLGLTGLALAQPANDAFDSPAILSGFPVTVTGTNLDATLEQDESIPDVWWDSAEASVWFRWTSPTTGSVQIDTLGSDFDTMLAVRIGDNLTDLELIAENDQYGGDQSAVFISVLSGVTYQIAVYGWYDARGSITLNITNDVVSRISGGLTGPDGTPPLQGIQANAYRWADSWWERVQSAETDASGDYSIGGLPAGTYRVEFQDWRNGDYAPEVYDDAQDLDSGTDIVVPADTSVTGIDASLANVAPPDPPRIVGLRLVGENDWEIQYVGTAGEEYILQESTSLTNAWDDVGTSLLCQPGTNTISRQSSAPRIFWRLKEFP